MILYFLNSNNKKKKIGQVKDCEEAISEIKAFCEERSFNIPYMRIWEENGSLWFDVSSHSEFFILDGEGITWEDYQMKN